MKKLNLKKDTNPNYLATICKIGETFPIEGADRLVKVVINGYDMVISKDMKEGDVVVYFPVESAINEEYLKANNLYEISECDRNANFEEVKPYVELAEKAKLDGDKVNFDKQWGEAKSRCGFFGKSGRVRILKLRGQYSQGFIAGVDSLVKAFPDLMDVDFEALIGQQFSHIGDDELCWKYIPPKKNYPEHISGNQRAWRKRMKNLKRFDRMIAGQFEFHYDTSMLNEHITAIEPYNTLIISTKRHGTSAIFANVLCNRKLSTWEKIKKFLRFKVVDKEYGVIYSSRSVIKNQYINSNADGGFYGTDVWACVYRDFSPYIGEGLTIYGEIVGYIEGTQQMIQKQYDYGCKPGQWKFMPYRITETDEVGNKKEWNVDKVDEWTHNLVTEHPELAEKVLFMDILYHGLAKDLYPDIPVDESWHQNILARMKTDTTHFHMEQNDPICKNKVPYEGVVVRIDDDKFSRAFKLKCQAFYDKEAKQHDKGESDMEEEA